ncbi:MAG: acyltransferase [Gammaproteobacteria bacterium CG_4_10_14_0_8_um_filter_38_16]|nr:MAG: acyltransferase [Gammaproteobacteria bacterium CG_4_10_14_0_8_um_filter_38_16]PJA02845.1 MAG: acyltransferase [Gammaproteobacteria bacterium CG_4_10_14_0_2_um_filter_38_22]PJB10306.1 MAG: acyltransferase [Gammaproteobacteria bacterium CG_4_9_14_3_um_filter_38_9]
MAKVIIAAIQLSSTNDVDENLATTQKLISEAAANGAQLVALPEMFAIMGEKATDKVLVAEKYGNGKIQSFLSQCAKQYNVWIVGGTIPITCDDKNKIRAACIVYNNIGDAVARYDKIHLFDATVSKIESYRESDTTEPGDAIVVVDTPIGKLGLAVCYDVRFPILFTELMNRGAEIIAVPSAFTVKTGKAHWHLLTRARAVDTFCYVIGSAQVGMHANGRQTYGHTLIVEPWGSISSEITEQKPGIAYANIDFKKLHDIRSAIPVKNHQKIK